MEVLKQKIANCTAHIGIIGLGYIGLTLAEAFGDKGFTVTGYDIDPKKVAALKQGISPLPYLPLETLFAEQCQGLFVATQDPSSLGAADVMIICVPTPINEQHVPDFKYLKAAAQTVANSLQKERLVTIQSTCYPGFTEEAILPLLESSGLKVGKDFFLAYVPEREDPGNSRFNLSNVPRIAGGVTEACFELTSTLYQQITNSVFRCSSPKVAEAAKVYENSYRLINIAFVDEMKEMFDHMGIDIMEVIGASSTKPFGFIPFVPGPGIGGECIPVDPVYLAWKAKRVDGPVSLIEAAELVNTRAPYFVVQKVQDALNERKKALKGANLLLLGVAFKKDVDDIRESPALKVFTLLKEKGANVAYHDPLVPEIKARGLQSVSIDEQRLTSTDAVVILTDHSSYNWAQILQQAPLVIDTRQISYAYPQYRQKVVHA